MKCPVVLALLALLLVPVTFAQEEQSSTLNFVVLRDYNGKPVQNASVILHPVGKNGKQGKGGYQLKTDAEGKTSFDGVPYGKLRIQVLAHGFQTYGDDFEISQPTTPITVRLKRPQGQYSIYGDQSANQKKPDNNPQ